MEFTFQHVAYEDLNARQQESFNFQKVSAVLADYGFTTIRLSDDWNGADFLALHRDGATLKMQLKGRLTFQSKYRGKELWVCFPVGNAWYIYPHDKLLDDVLAETNIRNTASWKEHEAYSFPSLSGDMTARLAPYRLLAASSAGVAE